MIVEAIVDHGVRLMPVDKIESKRNYSRYYEPEPIILDEWDNDIIRNVRNNSFPLNRKSVVTGAKWMYSRSPVLSNL